MSLIGRATLLQMGQPLPGDTKETLIRLLKRAVTELPWPELPLGTTEMLETHCRALTVLDHLGEPEIAVEISGRHVEDVERHVIKAPLLLAAFYICRLDWLLSAAWKYSKCGICGNCANCDEVKRGAYVAEAKGLMERTTRARAARVANTGVGCHRK
jgi:hypothetical protein